jgi:hypothetical protein
MHATSTFRGGDGIAPHISTEIMHPVTVTVTDTVKGNLLNTKVLTIVSRQLSEPVQSCIAQLV